MERMCKKGLSLFIAFTMAFGILIFDNGLSEVRSAGYDPNAATAYAKAHWNDGVGACDQFVKACLNAGGVTVKAGGCLSLKNALVNGGYGTLQKLTASGNLYKISDNPGIVSMGDPLFFVCTTCGGISSGSAWPHVALCGEGTGGYITDYAHNSAHNGASHKLWKDLQSSSHPGHTMEVYAFHMSTASDPTCVLTFDANGGTCSVSDKSVTHNSVYGTLPTPTREGCTFDGWYTSPTGGTKIAETDIVTLTADTTVYAHWIEIAPQVFTLTYDANGGEGAPAQQTGCGTITLRSELPIREGYIFLGWASNSSAASADYAPNASFELTKHTTLYAVWSESTPGVFTLTFNANGGNGAPAQQTGSGTIMLPDTEPTREGCVFLGWSARSAAVSAQYLPGSPFDLTESTTLYAVWKQTEMPYEPTDVPDADPAISICNYAAFKTVDYRTTITFAAEVQNSVSGAQVHWFVDGQDKGTGETFTVNETTASYTVQAKYIKNGKVLTESQVETVHVRTGFFARLKALFLALFGLLPKQVQEAYNIEPWLNLLP